MAFNIENVETRRYLYGIAAAGVPLLIALNLVTPAEADIYLNIATAVLGLSPVVALANTPKKGETLVISNEPK